MPHFNTYMITIGILLVFGTTIFHASMTPDSEIEFLDENNWYTPDLEWTKSYQGDDYDVLVSIHQNHFDGYDFFINSRQDDKENVYMVRTDEFGEVEWKKSLLDQIIESKKIEDVYPTKDNGYILAGEAIRPDTFEDVAMLIKLNDDGKVDWYKVFDENPSDSYMFSSMETNEGAFIAIGAVSHYENDHHFFACSLKKLDENGSVIWSKVYEKRPYHYLGWKVVPSNNDGFFLITDQSGEDFHRTSYLVKTDSDGDFLSQKELIKDSYFEMRPSLQKSNDGDYYFLGTSYDLDNRSLIANLVKFNDNGIILKSKIIASYWSTPQRIISSFIQTPDKGFVLTGAEDDKVFLLKLNSLFEEQWSCSYNDAFAGSDLIRLRNGGYAILSQAYIDDEYAVMLLKTFNSLQNPIQSFEGEQNGKSGKTYEYLLSARDSDGDNITYTIDWGDGIIEEYGPYISGEQVFVNHSWEESGDYLVKVKVNDIYGQESAWTSFPLKMPKYKGFDQILSNILHFLFNKNYFLNSLLNQIFL